MLRFTHEQLVYYQFEYLAAQADLVHGLFTRHGGVSPPPWASLNLSSSSGDSPANVAENNARLLAALGVRREQTVSAWLKHGTRVSVVQARHAGTSLQDVDALLTLETGLFLSMRFADCVPIVLYDAARGALGLLHAGWPGVAANIVSASLQVMQQALGCRPPDVWAGIGPAIRACCYQFGPRLAQTVVAACPPGTRLLVPQADGSLHLDLVAAVVAQLRQNGVTGIEDCGLCTACRASDWFSHRAEKKTGRFGVLVGRRPRDTGC